MTRRPTRPSAILLTAVAAVAACALGCGDGEAAPKKMPTPVPFDPSDFGIPDAGTSTPPNPNANGFLYVDPGGRDGTLVSQAVVTLTPTKKDGKGAGVVRFVITPDGIRVKGELSGLTFLAEYTLYVHVTGDCSAEDASSAGPTFNFAGSSLDPPDPRFGGLVQFAADVSGNAKAEGKVPGAALQGPYSIIGRTVVLHATGQDKNNPVYGAGQPLACGVIGVAAEFASQ